MNPRRVLLGERPEVRRRYGAVSIVLGFVAALVPVGVRASGATSGPGGNTVALGLALLLLVGALVVAVAGAVVASYRGAGIALCILLPTCVVFGVNVAHWTTVETLRWTLWRWSGPPLGLLLGLPVGVAGYLLGQTIRSAQSHVRAVFT